MPSLPSWSVLPRRSVVTSLPRRDIHLFRRVFELHQVPYEHILRHRRRYCMHSLRVWNEYPLRGIHFLRDFFFIITAD